jgi:transcriptional regulator with XRE-family HTH domain
VAERLEHRVGFGTQVRRLRLEKGWSQEDLAERAGIHRNYLGGIERAERNVGLDNIVAISRALNVSPQELFAEVG